MKKLFKVALCSLMALTLVACGSKGGSSESVLTVGTPELSGDFMNGFGNSSYDNYIKNMLYGFYTTYYADGAGEFHLDETAMAGVEVVKNDDGSVTHTFTVNEGLKWNDGETLDANDYVFGALWTASDEWVTVGASDSTGEGLDGYYEYNNGWLTEANGGELVDLTTIMDADKVEGYLATALGEVGQAAYDEFVVVDGDKTSVWMEPEGNNGTFKGVQLIDDMTFSVTIDANELPYFYETYYAMVAPMPLHALGEGVEIVSSENGTSLTGDIATSMAATQDEDGYRYAPTVTCGPYNFVSFTNQIVTMELNKEFVADPEGAVPTIEKVIVKYVDQSTDIDQLIAGEIDIDNGVVEGDKIEKAKAAVEDGILGESNYARNGFGYVAMATEYGVTAIPEVRHAIGYILDTDEIIQSVLGGYGTTVNGDYGAAQWMYKDNEDAVDALEAYTFSIDNANAELDKTDYKFEADGVTPFDASKATADGEYYRYNSAKEVLELKHMGTEDNTVTDAVESQFLAYCPLVGMKFSIAVVDFDTLLSNYYYRYEMGEDEVKYNTYNLAVSFTAVYDPYTGSYHSDYCGTWLNATQMADPELDKLIEEMRETDPTDTDGYSEKWLAYQTRWNELLPVVPIYSNSYFDYYSSRLEGMDTTSFWDWSNIICKIKIAE